MKFPPLSSFPCICDVTFLFTMKRVWKVEAVRNKFLKSKQTNFEIFKADLQNHTSTMIWILDFNNFLYFFQWKLTDLYVNSCHDSVMLTCLYLNSNPNLKPTAEDGRRIERGKIENYFSLRILDHIFSFWNQISCISFKQNSFLDLN